VLAAQPLAAEGVGGLILFGSSAPPSLPADLAALQRRAAPGPPLLVMADEEGGGVQRLANLAGNMPWPRDDGQHHDGRSGPRPGRAGRVATCAPRG